LKDLLFIKFLCFTVFSQWERVHHERKRFARNEIIDKEISIVFIIDAKVTVDASNIKYTIVKEKHTM